MEHLYTKTCFINEKIYTTSSGIVAPTFIELITDLAKRSKDYNVTVLCDILPINEVLSLFKSYDIKNEYNNALFTVCPMPIDMIKPNTIHLCIASFENAPQKIHQISFENNRYNFRFGIEI